MRADDADGYDFARLERGVRALMAHCSALERDRASLRKQLEESRGRVGELETELRALEQLRRDVVKRIDGLVGQIDNLEAERG